MSLTRKIAHNTIIQFIGKVFATLLGIATIAIMTRYLGTIGFGEYTTIIAYLQLFAILVDFGLALSVVQLMSQPDNDERKILNNVISMRVISAFAMMCLALVVSIFLPYSSVIKTGIAIVSVVFIFSSLNQVLIGVFQKKLKMGQSTIAEVAGRIILLVGVVIAVYINSGLYGILIAQIIAGGVSLLINALLARRLIRYRFAFEWHIWKKIWGTTWPIAVSISLNLIYFKADTLILSFTQPQYDVGIYGATYRVLEILTQFPYMFSGLVLPILTLHYAKNFIDFKRVFQKAFDFLVIAAIPIIVGTYFVADKLMVLVAGNDFTAAGSVLQIIILATGIIFINTLFGYTIVVINKQRQMIPAYILTASVALVGYIILIPEYSYIGAAWMTVAAESLIFLLNVIMLYKTTQYFPRLGIVFKSIAASVIMGIGIYFLGSLHIGIVIAVAAVIYCLFLFIFKGISKDTILEIISIRS